jgi:hypothetical protein
VNREQVFKLLAQDHRTRDRLEIRTATVFLSVSFLVMVVCPTLCGQEAQRNQSNPLPLPGYSVLDSSRPLSETTSKRSASHHATPVPSQPPASADAGEDIDKLLTRLVLENIPHEFEETKDWGRQKERWDGVKFSRDGLKIETQRRKKMVNHGTWKKYSAQLRNPKEEFTVQLKNMRETADEKLAFDVHFLAHVNVEGRQSKWVKGVQLYSVGVDGHTKIRLAVSMELEVKMGSAQFPPDLVFVPKATRAQLTLDEFRIDRIGKLGGEFAQQVSKGIRSKLDEKIAEKEVKLLDKINRQLLKKQDQLRISIADALKSKWTKSARAFLPNSIQASLKE